MKTFQFSFVVSGLDPQADDFEDRLFEAGCDDALISVIKGAVILDFDRQAGNFIHAMLSAYGDVRNAGANVVRVEPDPMVTISDIASRAGTTRQYISLLAKGERGRDFPPPVTRVTTESPLWDWRIVARWLFRNGNLDTSQPVLEAAMVHEINVAIGGRKSRLARVLEANS
jgi:hypothetical protein